MSDLRCGFDSKELQNVLVGSLIDFISGVMGFILRLVRTIKGLSDIWPVVI